MNVSIQVDNGCPFGLLVCIRHPYRLNFVTRVQLAFVTRDLLMCFLSFASLQGAMRHVTVVRFGSSGDGDCFRSVFCLPACYLGM
jgi:hypothetical protein